MVLQSQRENGQSKRAVHGVEPGLGLGRGHGVDAAEGEAEQTVGVLVGCEGAGHRCGGFNSLGGGSHTANDNFVGVDGSSGAGTVAVGDLPCGARNLLACIGFVVVMAGELSGGLEGGEGPAIEC